MRICEILNNHYVVPQNKNEEMIVNKTLLYRHCAPPNMKGSEVYSDYGSENNWSLFLKTYDMFIKKGGKK